MENRCTVRTEDAEISFLMSLLPQIRSLTEKQKNSVYIEFLTVLQRVKYSIPPQMQHISSQVSTGPIPFNYSYYNLNQTLPTFSSTSLNLTINPPQIETINHSLHSYYSQYNPQTSMSSSHSVNTFQHSDFENNNN